MRSRGLRTLVFIFLSLGPFQRPAFATLPEPLAAVVKAVQVAEQGEMSCELGCRGWLGAVTIPKISLRVALDYKSASGFFGSALAMGSRRFSSRMTRPMESSRRRVS